MAHIENLFTKRSMTINARIGYFADIITQTDDGLINNVVAFVLPSITSMIYLIVPNPDKPLNFKTDFELYRLLYGANWNKVRLEVDLQDFVILNERFSLPIESDEDDRSSSKSTTLLIKNKISESTVQQLVKYVENKCQKQIVKDGRVWWKEKITKIINNDFSPTEENEEFNKEDDETQKEDKVSDTDLIKEEKIILPKRVRSMPQLVGWRKDKDEKEKAILREKIKSILPCAVVLEDIRKHNDGEGMLKETSTVQGEDQNVSSKFCYSVEQMVSMAPPEQKLQLTQLLHNNCTNNQLANAEGNNDKNDDVDGNQEIQNKFANEHLFNASLNRDSEKKVEENCSISPPLPLIRQPNSRMKELLKNHSLQFLNGGKKVETLSEKAIIKAIKDAAMKEREEYIRSVQKDQEDSEGLTKKRDDQQAIASTKTGSEMTKNVISSSPPMMLHPKFRMQQQLKDSSQAINGKNETLSTKLTQQPSAQNPEDGKYVKIKPKNPKEMYQKVLNCQFQHDIQKKRSGSPQVDQNANNFTAIKSHVKKSNAQQQQVHQRTVPDSKFTGATNQQNPVNQKFTQIIDQSKASIDKSFNPVDSGNQQNQQSYTQMIGNQPITNQAYANDKKDCQNDTQIIDQTQTRLKAHPIGSISEQKATYQISQPGAYSAGTSSSFVNIPPISWTEYNTAQNCLDIQAVQNFLQNNFQAAQHFENQFYSNQENYQDIQASQTFQEGFQTASNYQKHYHNQQKYHEYFQTAQNYQNAQNSIKNEQNTIMNKQNTIKNEQNTIMNEQNNIMNEQNTIMNKQNTIKNEQNTILNEQNTIMNEQNTTINEQNTIKNELNTIMNEQNNIKNEQNTIMNKQNTIKNEQNTILNEQNTIMNEQNTTINEQNTIKNELNTIMNEQNNIMNEQNAIMKEQNTIMNEQNTIKNEQNYQENFANTQCYYENYQSALNYSENTHIYPEYSCNAHNHQENHQTVKIYTENYQTAHKHTENIETAHNHSENIQTAHNHPENIKKEHNYPENYQTAHNHNPENYQTAHNHQENIQTVQNDQENIHTVYNHPENYQTVHNHPDSIQTAHNYPKNIQTAQNYQENIQTAHNHPENYQTADNHPENYQTVHNQPENIQTAQNDQENIQTAHNHPENIQTAHNHPENYQTVHNNPEKIQTALNHPEYIQTAQNHPKNIQTAHNHPENIQTAHNHLYNYQTADNHPENYQTAHNHQENIQTAHNHPENIQTAHNHQENYQTAEIHQETTQTLPQYGQSSVENAASKHTGSNGEQFNSNPNTTNNATTQPTFRLVHPRFRHLNNINLHNHPTNAESSKEKEVGDEYRTALKTTQQESQQQITNNDKKNDVSNLEDGDGNIIDKAHPRYRFLNKMNNGAEQSPAQVGIGEKGSDSKQSPADGQKVKKKQVHRKKNKKNDTNTNHDDDKVKDVKVKNVEVKDDKVKDVKVKDVDDKVKGDVKTDVDDATLTNEFKDFLARVDLNEIEDKDEAKKREKSKNTKNNTPRRTKLIEVEETLISKKRKRPIKESANRKMKPLDDLLGKLEKNEEAKDKLNTIKTSDSDEKYPNVIYNLSDLPKLFQFIEECDRRRKNTLKDLEDANKKLLAEYNTKRKYFKELKYRYNDYKYKLKKKEKISKDGKEKSKNDHEKSRKEKNNKSKNGQEEQPNSGKKEKSKNGQFKTDKVNSTSDQSENVSTLENLATRLKKYENELIDRNKQSVEAVRQESYQELWKSIKPCEICKKFSKLVLCGNCLSVSYCNKECKREHWVKEHKKIDEEIFQHKSKNDKKNKKCTVVGTLKVEL